jgi:UDPglucose 6-dehydrogenase
VVVRSTVPPGTCEQVVVPLLEEISGKRAGEHFAVASNPEFLRSASAHEDFLSPWMTVIGSRSRRTAERLADLYRPFGGQIKIFSDPAEAELAKCAHNLFNAAKISFWNEMWLVARALGIPIDGIAQTVAYSAEGSVNPEYGIKAGSAYGGACLPKDAKGFLGFAAELGLEMPVLAGVIRVNEIMAGEPGADLAVEAHALAAGAEVHELPRNGAGHGNGHGNGHGHGHGNGR